MLRAARKSHESLLLSFTVIICLYKPIFAKTDSFALLCSLFIKKHTYSVDFTVLLLYNIWYGSMPKYSQSKEQKRMARIISFANQKGGVGKTTSAVNLAACVGVLGKRVLMVDLDPQGNTTSGFGINKKSVGHSSYDILIGKCTAKEAVISTEFRNLSVIASTISLAGAEFDLYSMENREFRLRETLKTVADDYDYIFIDCPPSLSMLTLNALSASDGVIIPMQCEYYALEGLSQLMITIRKIKQLYNPSLEITGILLTMFNGRLILTAQVVAELKKYYKDKLFKHTISRNVKLSEAPGFGMPVYYHDKYCKGSLEYLEVARELVVRI